MKREDEDRGVFKESEFKRLTIQWAIILLVFGGILVFARCAHAGPYFGERGEFLRDTEAETDQWMRDQEESRWRFEQRQEWIREQRWEDDDED